VNIFRKVNPTRSLVLRIRSLILEKIFQVQSAFKPFSRLTRLEKLLEPFGKTLPIPLPPGITDKIDYITSLTRNSGSLVIGWELGELCTALDFSGGAGTGTKSQWNDERWKEKWWPHCTKDSFFSHMTSWRWRCRVRLLVFHQFTA